uniref:Uncharacterized protein n=1 Tax=Cyanothece sp. (strain PCC 7425 / ATCC 29141) TaxID=395961 RepID=B8HN68_CYAP4
MTYPNDRDPQRRDVYTEPDRATRVEETHYADGSINRRVEQDRLYDPTARDTSNTAQGILIGILITALLGLGVLELV